MDNPVAPVLQDISGAIQSVQSDSTDVANMILQQGSKQADLASIAQKTADAASLIATQKGRAELDAQNAIATAARATGGDVTDTATDLIVPLNQRMRDLDVQSEQAFAEYRKRSETGFFDNPLAWVQNNIMGGTEQAKTVYNNVATQYNNTKDRLDGVISHTTEEARNALALERPISDATIAASATVAAYQYTKAATEAAYNVLGSNISALKEIQAGQLSAVQLRVEGWRLQNDEENHQMQKQQFAIAMDQYKEKKEGDELLSNVLTRGYAAFGITAPDNVNLKRLMTAYKAKVGGPELQAIVDAGTHSLFSKNPDGTPGTDNFIAATPGKAFMAIAAVQPNYKDDDPSKKPASYLASIYNELPAGVDLKNPNAVMKAVDTRVEQDVKNGNNNAENFQIFKDKGFKAVTDQNPAIKDSALYQQVIAPMVTAGSQSMPVAQLLAVTAQSVKTGKLTIEQARDGIAAYYGTAVALNNVANFRFGSIQQTAYRAKISDSMGAPSMDVSKPGEATGALVKLLYPNNTWNQDRGRWTFDQAAPPVGQQ